MLKLMTLSLLLMASLLSAEPKLEVVFSGLVKPWAIESIDSNTLLFTEKNGRIGVIDLNNESVISQVEVPNVYSKGQAALFDLALSASFENDGLIYFSYAKNKGKRGVTAVSSIKLKGGKLVAVKDLLVTDSMSNTNRHFGGRIAVDEKHLYLTVGERGVRDNAQDLTNHAGKILRFNLDGSATSNNPFTNKINAKPEIFTFGHRNPQGITFDNKHRLWSVEHGPRGGDELNLIEAGNNYGWPVVSLGKEYWGPVSVGVKEKEGIVQPIHSYVPSIAPSDLLFVEGRFYISALNGKHLNIVEIDSSGKVRSESRWFTALGERIRALAGSDDGFIYFATDSGVIYRFKPDF